MILAFDTSSAACTAALFDDGGSCIASRDEQIGRGHSERLVPMLAELLDGRSATRILVGVGPGSFTGIRVGIAAAHGLAIGWGAELVGMSSLALLAAGVEADGEVAAAILGGHGELFVQQFELAWRAGQRACKSSAGSCRRGRRPRNWSSARAHASWSTPAAGAKRATPGRLPQMHSSFPRTSAALPAKPVYARAPDARVKEAA